MSEHRQVPSTDSRGEITRLSFGANFWWTFLGVCVYFTCQWAVLILITKLGTPAEVGRFAFATAIATPIIMFTNLQLRAVQATDAAATFPFRTYFHTRVVTSAVALVALLAFAVPQYTGEKLLVVVVVMLTKVAESMSDVHYGLFQNRERMDFVATSMSLRGITGLSAFAAVFAVSGSLGMSLLALGTGWGIVYLLYDLRMAVRLHAAAAESQGNFIGRAVSWFVREKSTTRSIGALVALALPLGFVMMLISLESSIPRYIVETTLGESDLGFFAALAYTTAAGSAVVGALAQAATPRLAHSYFSRDLRTFRTVLGVLVLVTLLVGGGGILVVAFWGRGILGILYTTEFAGYSRLFLWVAVAGALQYLATALGAPVTAMRRFRIQLWVHAASALAVLTASLLLIGRVGIVGAAWAMMVNGIILIATYTGIVLGGLKSIGQAQDTAVTADPSCEGTD